MGKNDSITKTKQESQTELETKLSDLNNKINEKETFLNKLKQDITSRESNLKSKDSTSNDSEKEITMIHNIM